LRPLPEIPERAARGHNIHANVRKHHEKLGGDAKIDPPLGPKQTIREFLEIRFRSLVGRVGGQARGKAREEAARRRGQE
jgi:hypothetical protein